MPDDDARLADGVLVEADVHARVLGLRLLRLDATVVLLPAGTRQAAVPSAVPSVAAQPVAAQPVAASVGPVPQAPRPALHDGSAPLLRARKLLAEADELLARD